MHLGDGLDTSLGIYERLKPQIRRALFFLDGDHAYESVRRELEGIGKRAPDAIVLVHDTFNQSAESGYNTGPHRAIEEMIRTRPQGHARISTSLGLPGMTLLFPRMKG